MEYSLHPTPLTELPKLGLLLYQLELRFEFRIIELFEFDANRIESNRDFKNSIRRESNFDSIRKFDLFDLFDTNDRPKLYPKGLKTAQNY